MRVRQDVSRDLRSFVDWARPLKMPSRWTSAGSTAQRAEKTSLLQWNILLRGLIDLGSKPLGILQSKPYHYLP
jgi:hypothetical protein